jgi:hypothetical protein
MKASKAVASFDSATGMLRALSRFLAGRDTPALGTLPAAFELPLSGVLGALNRLPIAARERVYAASGWAEAIPRHRVGDVRSEALAEWVTGHYPRRRYPVIFIGSANGALVHLAAALDAAWLPQTLLLPVRRRGVAPDDPRGDLAAVRESGRALLAANPDLVLHHMHDPNQDRLMIAGMTYFRVKWHRLPLAYRRFIRDRLSPGGLLVIADCTLRWAHHQDRRPVRVPVRRSRRRHPRGIPSGRAPRRRPARPLRRPVAPLGPARRRRREPGSRMGPGSGAAR